MTDRQSAIRFPKLQAWQQSKPNPEWGDQRVLWTKLWVHFFEGSHIEFGAVEFGVIAWLMCQANRFGRQEDGSGLAVWASGKPINVEDICAKMQLENARCVQALEMAEAVGTIEIGSDFKMQTDEKKREKSGKISRKIPEKFTHKTEIDLKTENARGKPLFHLVSGTYSPSQKTIDNWVKTHPGVDVKNELLRCAHWCILNPARRSKTAAGAKRRINSWLAGELDKAKTSPLARPRQPTARLSQAQQLAQLAEAQRSTEEERAHG